MTNTKYTIKPLHWSQVTAVTNLPRFVADSVGVKLVISKSLFDNTYDIDTHTEGSITNLHYGVATLAEAKELAWVWHSTQVQRHLVQSH